MRQSGRNAKSRSPRRVLSALVLLAVLISALPAGARNVDTGEVVPFAGDGGLVSVGYANDYYSGTDRYYTQGVALDVFHPALHLAPLMFLLPALPESQRSYGLALRYTTFTPAVLNSEPAVIGDRPFANYAFLGHVLVSRDPARALTLTAEFDAGMIGPGTGAEGGQKWLHRVIRDSPPLGWSNQIRNDVLLDYYLRLEKTVEALPFEDLTAGVDATAGTVYDNASVETTFRLGRIAPEDRFRCYVFGRASEKGVGYDATLQGGVTNRDSPYTLSAARVRRLVPRADLGVAFDMKKIVLQAVWSDLGKEFSSGLVQRWTEISAMARF
jgi:hypothetical protein